METLSLVVMRERVKAGLGEREKYHVEAVEQESRARVPATFSRYVTDAF